MFLQLNAKRIRFMQHVYVMEFFEDTVNRRLPIHAHGYHAVLIRQLKLTLGFLIQIVAITGVTIIFENLQSIEVEGSRIHNCYEQTYHFTVANGPHHDATAAVSKGRSAILTYALHKGHLLQLIPDCLALTFWHSHIEKVLGVVA